MHDNDCVLLISDSSDKYQRIVVFVRYYISNSRMLLVD
ncbi:hypothetical protein YpMG051020_3327 [Yersinia pestis biovar Orientalis str. MG05-1020]|nr:hypothetical protein YpMG051020_3327 [Yersinia pestis biovar Orientalis str. MG05-1020]EIR64988.1 hypothetical protein YPPY25_2474 [Yersinia pestis PY-25]EIS32166.1 hypothetical protein YPPY56_2513 [Yersinia pestis PY-56]EIS95672.1 hypothetical protein YPPY89_2663 [Yersinia pestis PY-89]